MKVVIVLSMLCATALAGPVSPVIVPKVQVAPAQVTVVKQPYTIDEPEPVVRNIPVPYKAVTYTAPAVVPGPVLAPAHVAYAAPAVAPAPVEYAASAVYAAPVAHAAYAAPIAPAAYPAPIAYATHYVH